MKSTVSISTSIETDTGSYLFQALLYLTEVGEPTTTTAPTITTAAALATTNPDQTKPVEGKIFPTPFQYLHSFLSPELDNVRKEIYVGIYRENDPLHLIIKKITIYHEMGKAMT